MFNLSLLSLHKLKFKNLFFIESLPYISTQEYNGTLLNAAVVSGELDSILFEILFLDTYGSISKYICNEPITLINNLYLLSVTNQPLRRQMFSTLTLTLDLGMYPWERLNNTSGSPETVWMLYKPPWSKRSQW